MYAKVKGSVENPYSKSGYGYKIFSALQIRALTTLDATLDKVPKCRLEYTGVTFKFDDRRIHQYRHNLIYIAKEDQGFSFFFAKRDAKEVLRRWNKTLRKLAKERVIAKIEYKNCIYRLYQSDAIFSSGYKVDIGICKEFTLLEIVE